MSRRRPAASSLEPALPGKGGEDLNFLVDDHRKTLYTVRARELVTERGAVWSAHLLWEQGVAGSNPAAPTTKLARFILRP